MRSRSRLVTPLLIAGLLAASATLGACGGARRERIYDPYYYDYHRWDRAELGFYRRWEVETHLPHLDFGRRPVEEQHAYFAWRHAR
ncbi:MAG TPA: hypothetical protein VKA84_28080 [Gemmatimonadaceae bacterium]|nr:hypothetical protein [Gemmatimonadaceae bacterium]